MVKIDHNITAYIHSNKAERDSILITSGEYKIVKRKTTDIGEEVVWIEYCNDVATFTSAPLIAATRYGRTELGIALDGDVIYRCEICGKAHPSKKTGTYAKDFAPLPPSSLSTEMLPNGKTRKVCLNPRLCKR